MFKSIVKTWMKRFFAFVTERTVDSSVYVKRSLANHQYGQILLTLEYRELLRNNAPLPEFGDIEFSAFSQNGEDGILLFIFALVGHGGRRAVEICAGDGIECNSANLMINHGWTGLLLDGSAENIQRGNRFYQRCQTTFCYPPRLVQAWVTAENVNDLIRDNGVEGEIDLLSIDIDGVDYWLWKAIDVINPRVVILEYNSLVGMGRSITIPYDPQFQQSQPGHVSASLPAFVKLGQEKGYRLVGVQRYGFNAIFLRNDVGAELFPEIAPDQCNRHYHALRCEEDGRRLLASAEWVEV